MRINEDDAISYTIIPGYKSKQKLTRDLSLGGIRFISDHFIPPHSILKIEIRLEHAHKVINAVARLVWIRSVFNDECYEIGVEFVDINRTDLKSLNYYLNLHS